MVEHENLNTKNKLVDLWNVGVNAVSGKQAVIRALLQDSQLLPYRLFQPDYIVSIGKAASSMCLGALQTINKPCPAIVVSKYGHIDESLKQTANVETFEAGHPIPDKNSLIAGSRILEAVGNLPKDAKLLLLISGGTSALTECLPDDTSLSMLQTLTEKMLASGETIQTINAKRQQISKIKAGKLLKMFNGGEVKVYAISDVEGDSISVIGSGTGDCSLAKCRSKSRIVATNQAARMFAEKQAIAMGLSVIENKENLYEDVFLLSLQIANRLKLGKSGVYIWGGEPTIKLPKSPGVGGRNQSLALALAKEISGENNITLLVAGTDGTDGPSNAAGGLVDGNSVNDKAAAEIALKSADAGSYLKKTNNLFVSGPTNTNVMDLLIAIVE